MLSLVDEIAPAENGISSATAVGTEVDDGERYNITIDKMALSADDSIHVDGYVPSEIFLFGNLLLQLIIWLVWIALLYTISRCRCLNCGPCT